MSCTSCRIWTARQNKKYFISVFQALNTKTRRSYSEAFIYLKSLKIICEQVNLNEVPRYQPASWQKSFLHILLHVFCVHCLRIHQDYFFQRVFENVGVEFLSGNISGLLVIYLFDYNSSKSTFSMLKMQLHVFLSTVFIK